MRVLFASLYYDYGKKERGESFEYTTFYNTLSTMEGVSVDFFAVDKICNNLGRDGMNEELIRRVNELKPDLLFCFLYLDEIKKETIDFITKKTKTKTFNWFADDHWRFFVFSKNYAPLFTLVSTTENKAFENYKKLGINNVIRTQWAADTRKFRPVEWDDSEDLHDVTFVGQGYGARISIYNKLNATDMDVKFYGRGFSDGRISFDKMIQIFSNSKINLNLTESLQSSFRNLPKEFLKIFFVKTSSGYSFTDQKFVDNLNAFKGRKSRVIKARTFEIPACGGFTLTGYVPGIEEYFAIGKEIIVYNDINDLIEKCRFYTSNDLIRNEIASQGNKRVLEEHTYEARFKEIFNKLELEI